MPVSLPLERRYSVADVRADWRADFEVDCYRSAIAHARRLFLVATLLNAVALVAYDLPLFLNGLHDTHPRYFDLLVWRIVNMTTVGAYLLVSARLNASIGNLPQLRNLSWIAIVLAVGLGAWHAILSQRGVVDFSIYTMVLFFVAVLMVTPGRGRIWVYPIGLIALLTGVALVQSDKLVASAVSVNALCVTVCAMFASQVSHVAAIRNFVLRRTLDEERCGADQLLRKIMPDSIADRLKHGDQHVVEFHDEVTVLFADVVGFTKLASELEPSRLINLLETLFKAFDDLADDFGVEKIKTVGDAYMAAAGVPEAVPDHAERVARMALAMMATCERIGAESAMPLHLRVGIATGPAISGVIAQKKFAYDLWGDTVNTASRMETSGVVGRIHVTEQVRTRLSHRFHFELRGSLDVKGKGAMPSFFLIGDQTAVAA